MQIVGYDFKRAYALISFFRMNQNFFIFSLRRLLKLLSFSFFFFFCFQNDYQALYLNPSAKGTGFKNKAQQQHYCLMWIVIVELSR